MRAVGFQGGDTCCKAGATGRGGGDAGWVGGRVGEGRR